MSQGDLSVNRGVGLTNGERKTHTTHSLITLCHPLTPSDTRPAEGLPYDGPVPSICSRHRRSTVDAVCPDCYLWTVDEEEESKQPDAGTVPVCGLHNVNHQQGGHGKQMTEYQALTFKIDAWL